LKEIWVEIRQLSNEEKKLTCSWLHIWLDEPDAEWGEGGYNFLGR